MEINYIYRTIYFLIKKYINRFPQKIINICGIPGSGKTVLLNQLYNEMKNENIYFFSFKDVFDVDIKEFSKNIKQNAIVLIDDIIHVKNYENLLDYLIRANNCRIICSNIFPIYTNPFLKINSQTETLYPLRFIEYINYKGLERKKVLLPTKKLLENVRSLILYSSNITEFETKYKYIKPELEEYFYKIKTELNVMKSKVIKSYFNCLLPLLLNNYSTNYLKNLTIKLQNYINLPILQLESLLITYNFKNSIIDSDLLTPMSNAGIVSYFKNKDEYIPILHPFLKKELCSELNIYYDFETLFKDYILYFISLYFKNINEYTNDKIETNYNAIIFKYDIDAEKDLIIYPGENFSIEKRKVTLPIEYFLFL